MESEIYKIIAFKRLHKIKNSKGKQNTAAKVISQCKHWNAIQQGSGTDLTGDIAHNLRLKIYQLAVKDTNKLLRMTHEYKAGNK